MGVVDNNVWQDYKALTTQICQTTNPLIKRPLPVLAVDGNELSLFWAKAFRHILAIYVIHQKLQLLMSLVRKQSWLRFKPNTFLPTSKCATY